MLGSWSREGRVSAHIKHRIPGDVRVGRGGRLDAVGSSGLAVRPSFYSSFVRRAHPCPVSHPCALATTHPATSSSRLHWARYPVSLRFSLRSPFRPSASFPALFVRFSSVDVCFLSLVLFLPLSRRHSLIFDAAVVYLRRSTFDVQPRIRYAASCALRVRLPSCSVLRGVGFAR